MAGGSPAMSHLAGDVHASHGPPTTADGRARPCGRGVIVRFRAPGAVPGDPAAYCAGPAATKEAIEQIRVSLGLDKPLIVQFGRYLGDLMRNDLGNSLTTGQPVGKEIRERLPASA